MKKNHNDIIRQIKIAINLCGDQFALQETRAYLNKALASVGSVAKKRSKRFEASDKFKEQAKQNYQKWWDKIVENVKKSAEENLKDIEKKEDQ